uniref:Uncharacterized protein n=1 Tax=Salvator merianae TaxID=96440 RepID=A0A8D0BIT6_SALMN
MVDLTVKDVTQKELVRALAAFLKNSRKWKVSQWIDTVNLAKHTELVPSVKNGFCTRATSLPGHIK